MLASEYVARLKAQGDLPRLRPGSDPLHLSIGVTGMARAHADLADIVKAAWEHANRHGTTLPASMPVPECLVRPL